MAESHGGCRSNPKKAFWEYRSASTPILMDLRYDRFRVFGNETVNVEAWICNDPDEVLQNARMHYQVFLGDKLLLAESKALCVPACDVQFQGFIPIALPNVASREELKIQAAIFGADGSILDSYELKLDVLPAYKANIGKLCLIGASEAFRAKMAAAFEMTEVDTQQIDSSTCVLVCDYEQYRAHECAILDAVAQGARLLFMCLPIGSYAVAGQEFRVKQLDSAPSHFITRNREHTLTKDLKSDDVRYWYDESLGYLSPILQETLEAEGFEWILTSAAQNETSYQSDVGRWHVVPALVRKKVGDGYLIVCQPDLQHRIATNPVAKLLLERLFTEP